MSPTSAPEIEDTSCAAEVISRSWRWGDGPVWKWMALDAGVLYALVGEKEPAGDALKGPGFRGAGWRWWKIDQYAWGFGRTILAIDPARKKVLWQHRETEPLDTRAMCLKGERLLFYSHRKYLGCRNTKTGETVWKTDEPAVLDAIGEHHPAQFPATGFATSAYAKCSEDAIYFAGPTRAKLVAVSAKDGKMLWQYPQGAFQLVLRENTLYALGANQPSQKFNPLTGEVLGSLPNRAGCTRATGSVDRIFVRGGGDGTFSWETTTDKLWPISPMRPACHDGVVVAGGQLYWGPWMCGIWGMTLGKGQDASKWTQDDLAEIKAYGLAQWKDAATTAASLGEQTDLLVRGDAAVTTDCFEFVANEARKQGVDVVSILPPGKVKPWVDVYFILTGAQNVDAAHAWINYAISPQPMAQLAANLGTAVSSSKSYTLMDRELVQLLGYGTLNDAIRKAEFNVLPNPDAQPPYVTLHDLYNAFDETQGFG